MPATPRRPADAASRWGPVRAAALWFTGLAAALASPGSMPADVEAKARAARDLPVSERVERVSGAMLGVPYVRDPLGEGRAPDPDPLARYDGFDCQTYVEEVLALALSADPADAGRVRAAIRYGAGPIDYAHRRHFTELQWLPGNVADGWLVETTADYGAVQALSATVDAATWASWKDRSKFAIPDALMPVGQMRLDILPMEAAIAAAPRIRAGSVVLIVRRPRPGIPIWTSHMGIQVSGGMFRNASLTHHEVRDQDLADYLRDASTWKGWPAIGIAVLEAREQGPRRTLAR